MQINELMSPTAAAQAMTAQDDAARRQQGAQSRTQTVQQTAAAIEAEQKSQDPLDRRIAQARSMLAQLLQQKERLQAKPATPGTQPPTGAPAAVPSASQVPTGT